VKYSTDHLNKWGIAGKVITGRLYRQLWDQQ